MNLLKRKALWQPLNKQEYGKMTSQVKSLLVSLVRWFPLWFIRPKSNVSVTVCCYTKLFETFWWRLRSGSALH